MSEAIPFDIYCTSKNQQGGNLTAIIQINRTSKGGAVEKLLIPSGHKKVFLSLGDKLQCLQGSVYIHIKPGSPATGFHLKEQKIKSHSGDRTDAVVITNDLIRNPSNRGRVDVAPDIGNITRSTGGTTR